MIFFIFLVSLILGLYVSRNNFVISIILCLLFLIFVFIRFKKKCGIIALTIMAVGISLPYVNSLIQTENNQYEGIVVERKDNYYLFLSRFEKFYIYEEGHDKEIGDYLIVCSKPQNIEMTEYESRFSFQDYLSEKGVQRSLLSNDVTTKFRFPLRLSEIKTNFLNQFDEETKFLIDAFLFNEKNYESSTIKIADKLNLIFLFSMSGIYLSFLLNGLRKLLSLFLKEKWADTIAISVFLPYFIFIFPKVGMIRVTLCYLFRVINKHLLKGKFSALSRTSLVALLLLSFDFNLAYQSAFYIGFALALFLIFAQPALSSFKKKKRAFLVPIFIYMLTIPFSNLATGEWYIFNGIFQLFLVPFNEIFIILSMFSFYLTIPFRHLLSALSNVFTNVYTFIDLNSVAIPVAGYVQYSIPCYYVCSLYLLYLIESKRYFHLKFGSIPIVSSLCLSLIPLQTFIVNGVYFINVGQGDSILIKNKDNVVMIDTGGNKSFDMANEVLIPFLNKKQINHIDALIVTHNDFDHSGAVVPLINNFPVYNYLTKPDDFPYRIGDISLTNLNDYQSDETNDTSLVFNIDFIGYKWLLMGDATIDAEKFLIDENKDINCDILKVGHHGSKTSTSDEFLKYASPQEAIISVGAKNSYHHPNEEVLARLNKYGIKIRRTDIEGTISYVQIAT